MQVRAAATVAAVSVVSGSTFFMPAKVAAFIHVSSFGIWLGTLIWNTFFVGLTMFKNMPRQVTDAIEFMQIVLACKYKYSFSILLLLYLLDNFCIY